MWMGLENPDLLRERIEAVTGRTVDRTPTVTDDTSAYMSISTGTVLSLEGSHYFVTGEAKEGRFGIVEQPKFWVKYAYDLEDGTRKVIKLVFHEQFTTALGAFKVRCRRDPDKESRILELTTGDERFMQGRTVRDRAGNNVRVLDHIRGKSLYSHVVMLDQPHEVYFHETLPGILSNVAGCIEAIAVLHAHGEQHGDVRNDHIIIERDTGRYRWIDFDYSVNYLDYDVWSMGNILTYAVGKGIRTCKEAIGILSARGRSPAAVTPDDALLFFKYRMANLRKVYPYIPKELNELLMRFSTSTLDFYENLGKMAQDLRDVLELLGPQEKR
jgi:hypothetical protein